MVPAHVIQVQVDALQAQANKIAHEIEELTEQLILTRGAIQGMQHLLSLPKEVEETEVQDGIE